MLLAKVYRHMANLQGNFVSVHYKLKLNFSVLCMYVRTYYNVCMHRLCLCVDVHMHKPNAHVIKQLLMLSNVVHLNKLE